MNRLEIGINQRRPSRFHFVIGHGIEDLFWVDNLGLHPFLAAFNMALAGANFHRIIHVSPTNIVHCIDETSKANSANILWEQRDKVLSTGIIQGIATGPLSRSGQKPLFRDRGSENGLGDVHGIRLLDELMKDASCFRSATVIFDALSFAAFFEAPRLLSGILNEWLMLPPENSNEVFFVVPVNTTQQLNELLQNNLLAQFLSGQAGTQPLTNLISVESPVLDEIRNLFSQRDHNPRPAVENLDRLARICSAENTPLRVWQDRINKNNHFDLTLFRKNGWISSANQDTRSVEEKISTFLGMEEVKESIREINNFARYAQGHPETSSERSYHMVFYGSPGTGKTSVARIFGQVFQECGLLDRGHLIEVKGSDLIAAHVGGTGVKTNSVIDQASGGILFIDEAYSLSAEDRGGFGREALEVLLKRMEDERNKLVVILAGYKDEMLNFFRANPGLERRFPAANRLEFADLAEEQLKAILFNGLGEKNIQWTEDIGRKLSAIVTDLYRRRTKSFGNAGEMRNLIEAIEVKHKARLAHENLADDFLLEADIPEKYRPLVGEEKFSMQEILQPLAEMSGLEHIRRHILSLARLIKLDRLRSPDNLPERAKYVENYLFLGNPGTGKTTSAKVMGDVLHRLGILKTGNVVEVTAADLIAGYVGQTPEKTRRVVESAVDGILFIDEAYTLLPGPGDGSGGYGREVIDTLVKSIELQKGHLVVILAGYPAEMYRLLAFNPGLKSRFTKMLSFPDLSPENLGSILEKMAFLENYILPDPVLQRAVGQLLQVREMTPLTFGNAREAQRLFKHMVQNLADRVLDYADDVSQIHELPEDWNTFIETDVDAFEVILDQEQIHQLYHIENNETKSRQRTKR